MQKKSRQRIHMLQRNLFLLSSTDTDIRSPKRVQVSADNPSYQETKIAVHFLAASTPSDFPHDGDDHSPWLHKDQGWSASNNIDFRGEHLAPSQNSRRRTHSVFILEKPKLLTIFPHPQVKTRGSQ
jgi:hypothetical protein